MRISNNEKYLGIIEEEKIILAELKTNLIINKKIASNNISLIKDALKNNVDGKTKIDRLNKIDLAMISLLEKIAKAESVEELIELKKGIEAQIRKIRRILMNIENFDATKTEEFIKETRNNISKLMRNKKRTGNLELIENLLKNENNLTELEKKLLINKLRNEKAYIKRYYHTIREEKKSVINPNDNLGIKKNNHLSLVFEHLSGQKTSDIKLDELKLNLIPTKKSDILKNATFKISKKETKYNFEEELKTCCSRYNVVKPKEYGNNIAQNIVTFFDNIAIYRNNKLSLKKASADYSLYSSFEGIKIVINYLQEVTSFKGIINRVFPSTRKNYIKVYNGGIVRNEINEADIIEKIIGSSYQKTYSNSVIN